MIPWGITAGLIAAFAQSCSYFFSRRFLQRFPAAGLPSLLLTSHLYMGGASLLLLLLLGHDLRQIAFLTYALPLAGATGCYLLGQTGLFQALRHAESSRVAAFLGLKILFLAGFVTLAHGQALGPVRWLAVFLSVAAAFCLNEAGGRLPAPAIAGLAVAVVGYSFSDLAITALITTLRPALGARAPVLAVALCYLLSGLLSLPFLLARRREPAGAWRGALPYAAIWFIGILFLFACFGQIGTVFGNVVQATRSVMAILLGWAVMRRGWHHLEAKVPPAVFWKRLAGAALMTSAVALYTLAARR
ncbi:MAG: EamA family transporter [Lentisphaeria bacterium]|jgi:drug/metabolite transporter (DMT)-like permease